MADAMIPMPGQTNVVPRSANTNVLICSGIPWDNRYKHVRRFGSKGALHTYVSSMSVRSITRSTPVNMGRFDVRIPYNEMVGYMANYIAFQNNPFTSEWKYGFITRVEPNGDNSSIVHFEPDRFQNNFYDLTIKPCFVVREHLSTAQDTIGANIVPEDIQLSDPYIAGRETADFGQMYVCAVVTETSEGVAVSGEIYNNVYSGCQINTYNLSAGVDTLNALLAEYTNNGLGDAIQSLFMAPSICVNNTTITTTVNASSAFGSYTPKNNKMYTYPYAYVVADDHQGNVGTYRIEHLNADTSRTFTFETTGVLATSPAVYTKPINYRGVAVDNQSSIQTSIFPICAWSTDTYQAWLAQNKSSLALSSLSSGAQVIGGLATGNAALAVSGGLSVANTVARSEDINAVPNQARGSVLSENVNTALGLNNVSFYVYSQRPQMAQRIDNYFSAFGYKVATIKTPNITSRSSWNYVQTIDCGFTGTMDVDDLNAIRKMFDDGVTIWHTNDIGNYNLANT